MEVTPEIPKKVVCIGIGGNAVYYVAKYLHLLGVRITGYDINKNKRTKQLESLGVPIIYRNPNERLPPCEYVIYSDSLPNHLVNSIKNKNAQTEFIEVGAYCNKLFHAYENDKLSTDEVVAFNDANIAPLYKLDLSGIKLIGVTGTDGKTTVASMIYHILSEMGYTPGMISSIGTQTQSQILDSGFHTTTPSQHELQSILAEMKSQGCTHIIIECTSQGIFMGRLAGVKFDVAVYTNITSDHIGYHKTWQHYAQAKSQLVTRHLKNEGTVILNKDDKRSYGYLKGIAGRKILYSTETQDHDCDDLVVAEILKKNIKGVKYRISEKEFHLPMPGEFNVSNALASAGVLKALGLYNNDSLAVLEHFPTTPGRMEIIQKYPYTVIIDFAHTPNGLKNALETAKNIAGNRRLIVVFGCAAQRDDEKRKVMGKHSKEYADITILTAEDCRSESLKSINDQIEQGWKSYETDQPRRLIRYDDDQKNVKVRRDAIRKALSIARESDVVLITGKGHEKSLCFGNVEYAWNEVVEVKKQLASYQINDRAINVIKQYQNIPYGDRQVRTPYFINLTESIYRDVMKNAGISDGQIDQSIKIIREDGTLLGNRAGKGSPIEIERNLSTLIKHFRNQDMVLTDPCILREFMKIFHIGIDCSGFVFNLLNEVLSKKVRLKNFKLLNWNDPDRMVATQASCVVFNSDKLQKIDSGTDLHPFDLLIFNDNSHIGILLSSDDDLYLADSSIEKDGISLSKVKKGSSEQVTIQGRDSWNRAFRMNKVLVKRFPELS